MSAKYTTLDAAKSDRGPGTRDSATLTSMFVTPTELTSYIADPSGYKTVALVLLLDGPAGKDENIQVGAFSRDYSSAPSYNVIAANIAAGAVVGPPASPWLPNTSSPGPGSIDPIDRPAAPITGIYSSDTATVTVPNGSNATSVITPARDPSKSSINMAKRVDTMQPPGFSPATINSSG